MLAIVVVAAWAAIEAILAIVIAAGPVQHVLPEQRAGTMLRAWKPRRSM
ncbi:MAG: hypothetical protein JSR21_21115 [Proteobacteria bacterium]|nr:hypothetical protein [Pseudomonadota bacterium]